MLRRYYYGFCLQLPLMACRSSTKEWWERASVACGFVCPSPQDNSYAQLQKRFEKLEKLVKKGKKGSSSSRKKKRYNSSDSDSDSD